MGKDKYGNALSYKFDKSTGKEFFFWFRVDYTEKNDPAISKSEYYINAKCDNKTSAMLKYTNDWRKDDEDDKVYNSPKDQIVYKSASPNGNIYIFYLKNIVTKKYQTKSHKSKKNKIMKTFLTTTITSIFISANAQITPPAPPVIKDRGISSGLKVNSRKSTLVEKEIINLSKFKNLNIQKIILKDISDNTTETTLGIMTEYETFDRISKKTLTVEKSELSKLIQSLETLEQKQSEPIGNSDKKYKFTLTNNIEIGAVYKESQKNWVNYFIFPTEYYSHSVNEFGKDELKDLIKILKKAEKEI